MQTYLNQSNEQELKSTAQFNALLALIFFALLFINFSTYAQKNQSSRYFVIQNLATEKTRVYERCSPQPCFHKMVVEIDMVIGRSEESEGLKTRVGHSKIATWKKFYEDGNLNYPAWYHPRFDGPNGFNIPESGQLTRWTSSEYLTDKTGQKIGQMRGAFGWYAAILTPQDAVDYQWIHGTIGWGSEGNKPITATRGFLINIFANPGSHGCTRLENRAIAYLRHILEPGTDIYRIYAREAIMEKKQIAFSPIDWKFILTKNGAQQDNGLTAAASVVSQKNIDPSNILETGSYTVDTEPDAMPIRTNQRAASGKSGDRYSIGADSMFGHYIVDVGLLDNYLHPQRKVVVGGLPAFKTTVPNDLVYKSKQAYFIPPVEGSRNINPSDSYDSSIYVGGN